MVRRYKFRTGYRTDNYGVGMMGTDWGAWVDYDRMRNDSIEPFAGKSGVGAVRLGENVIVRPDEPEILSKFPFEESLSD